MKKALFFLHGIVLAIGCPVVLYGHVLPADDFAPASVLLPALLFVCLNFAIYGIIFGIIRNASASALIASIVLLGVLYQLPFFIAAFCAFFLGVAALYLRRRKIRFDDAHWIMNAISIVVVGSFGVQFVASVVAVPWDDYRELTLKTSGVSEVVLDPDQRPDVYYIILDGYARADVLKDLYGYDNSAYIEALEQRGFTVAAESRSNYPRTSLSLASSLNMQYLDSVSEIMGQSSSLWPLSQTLKHSTVRTIFEKSGYQAIFFADEWSYSDVRDGDVYVKPGVFFLNGLGGAIISRTNLQFFASALPTSFVSFPDYDSHREIILTQFEKLPEVARLPGPKFVYVHIVAPHPPFVFDENGKPINPSYGYTLNDDQSLFDNTAQYTQSYLAQLDFINRQTLTALNGILANSETPPVIILQADHGPAIQHYYFTIDELSTFERYSILNAYYLPGVDSAEIPQDITPVNSFRFVFNKYFGTDYELLPNRQYFPTGSVLYQFKDVTDHPF